MFPNSLVVCIPDIAAAFGFIYLIGGMGGCVYFCGSWSLLEGSPMARDCSAVH